MAVDITLVLRSEHRRLQKLADRCGRNSRGFHDPVCDLRRALRAHTRAASELYSSVGPGIQDGAAAATLADVRQSAENDAAGVNELVRAVVVLVASERENLIVGLEALQLPVRRRLGKVFRMLRDAELRESATAARRRRSQTELYELACRARIEKRSQMTQVQLQRALEQRGIWH